MRAIGELPDDPLVHEAVLAYASDYSLLESILRRHGKGWRTPGLRAASLDHAMWFHRPARADEWLLYAQHSPSAQGGRGPGHRPDVHPGRRARRDRRPGGHASASPSDRPAQAAPTRWPSTISTTRSAIDSSTGSCVVTTVVIVSSLARRAISIMISRPVSESSWPGGLVGEQQPRPGREGAGQRDPLLLPARQLARTLVDVPGEARRARAPRRPASSRSSGSTSFSRNGIPTFSRAVRIGTRPNDWKT